MSSGDANIIITGASDGIGLELIRLYARDKKNLLGIGRRPEGELPEAWPKDVKYFQGDQGAPDFADHLLDVVQELGWDHVDNLILNAGVGKTGAPQHETASNINLTLNTNLNGPIVLAQKFYPLLAASPNRPCLPLIGSTAYKGAAGFASYAASKAGLAGFARALKQEWQGQIDVQILHPGPTATNMHKKAGLKLGVVQKLFIDPQSSARMIKNKIARRTPVATIGFKARGLDLLKNLFGQGA